MRESLWLSAFYITVGLAFSGWVWQHLGSQAALDYLTGFVVEKSLAMDNIFVIAVIFAYFGVPRAYQHRMRSLSASPRPFSSAASCSRGGRPVLPL